MKYAILFDTLDELVAAERLLGRNGAIAANGLPDNGMEDALVRRIGAGLKMSPLNRQKAEVLRTWLDAPEGDWVPFATTTQAFVVAGIGEGKQAGDRAAAAIRDLSWQMGQVLTSEDLAGLEKPIEALASRSRAAGATSYRLTREGRAASQQYLKEVGAVS